MKNNKPKKNVERKRLYVCPRCMSFHYSFDRFCDKCGCNKCYRSVLRHKPVVVKEIPKEDWMRIIEYRKINGYSYMDCLKMYREAPIIGVRIPRDDKPCYMMKGLRKPKAQTGGFGGIANHSGITGNVKFINGGSCTPK